MVVNVERPDKTCGARAPRTAEGGRPHTVKTGKAMSSHKPKPEK
jgi:hypothetical protein